MRRVRHAGGLADPGPGGRASPGRRRGGAVHRRPGLRRLPGGRAARAGSDLLRPERAHRRLGRVAAVHRAPGPRPDALPHPRWAERPLLLGERQPRRTRAGERGREPGVREHRHGLLQGSGDDRRPGKLPRSRSEGAALPHGRGNVRPARPAAALRLKAADQGDRRCQQRGQRPRLRLRQRPAEPGLERLGLLLRVEPVADAWRPLHRHRHQLGGRHRRRRVRRAVPRTGTSTTRSSSGFGTSSTRRRTRGS